MSISDRASVLFSTNLAVVHSFQNPPRRPKSVASFRLWTLPVGANPPVGTSDEERVHAVMVAPMAGEERLPSTTKRGMPSEFELSQRTDAPLLAEPFFVSAPLFTKMTFSVSPVPPLGTKLSIDNSGEQRVCNSRNSQGLLDVGASSAPPFRHQIVGRQ